MSNFADQFQRLTGGDAVPFPWQARVWEHLRRGEVPAAVDVPTGLGKTSVLACWLLAHASRAADSPGKLPRRLVYVVDRRAVVDQASSEAETLAVNWHKVAGPASPGLRLGTLRGQHIDSGAWLDAPGDLAIVVGTVDMIGSRLLFSGYGVSPGMRPVHAGLLGTDTLLVLDEAHLAPSFAAMIRSVAGDPTLAGTFRPPAPPFSVMALSATQRPGEGVEDGAPPTIIRLDDTDRANPTVSKRLHAPKAVELRRGATTDDIVAAVSDLFEDDRRIVVFLDSRRETEKVSASLAKVHGQSAVLTFTGGRRAWERMKAEAELRDAGFLAGSPRPEGARILVATSAAEVGVDLDADHAVLDLVAWERMVQRLGRVNRRGLGAARIIVCDGGSAESRGASLASCRELLARLESASPAALVALASEAPAVVERASTPAPLRPPLARAEIDAWSLTGLADHPGRADVAPFLRGWVDEEARVRLAWRSHLPDRPSGDVTEHQITRFFESAPVHLSEVLEIEIGPFRDWLKKRAGAKLTDDATMEEREVALIALDRQGRAAERLTLGALRARMRGSSVQVDRFVTGLVGRTVVLDARLGGLTERGTLDATAAGPVPCADAATAREGAPSWADTVGFSIVVETARDGEVEAEENAPVLFALPLSDEVAAEAVDTLVVRARGDARRDTAGDARSRGRNVTLADHTAHVGRHAAEIAHALQLSEPDRALLDLAADLHDKGKGARHWQTAMNAEPEGGPWAKTHGGDGRKLEGYRHEFGSLVGSVDDPRLAALADDERDLVLHLIASHHGHARPFLAAHGGDAGPPSAMVAEARAAALRFARLSRLWGPWGLAWWEAVFRAADRAASKAEQERADG